jgi:hypothetical protein
VKIQPVRPAQGIILCFTDVTIETGASVNGAIFAQTAVALQKATITSDVGMCAEPASEAPFRRSLHWTVRFSFRKVRPLTVRVSEARPLDRPVFQVLSRRLDLRRFRVVARDKQTAFSPLTRVRRAFFKKEPITVVRARTRLLLSR